VSFCVFFQARLFHIEHNLLSVNMLQRFFEVYEIQKKFKVCRIVPKKPLHYFPPSVRLWWELGPSTQVARGNSPHRNGGTGRKTKVTRESTRVPALIGIVASPAERAKAAIYTFEMTVSSHADVVPMTKSLLGRDGNSLPIYY